jgi:PPM family protein phosphatase
VSVDRVWELVVNQRDASPDSRRLERGQVAWFASAGPTRGPEESNEDSLAVLETAYGGIVLAIADGVGGHPSGEHASRVAIEQLANAVTEHAVEPLRVAVVDGFERANREVCGLGKNAATTLSVVEIDDTGSRCFHAGDSTALVVGQRGRQKFLSMSHSPVGYALEAGFLDESEAMVHEERHLISNLVGSDAMNIQIGPRIRLSRHDTVLVGSDGVFDNATVQEITEVIRKGPLPAAAANLRALCARRMDQPEDGAPSKPDDMSFILFRR